MRQPDDPFHVVGHRVDGQPDKTRFSVMVNNKRIFLAKVPLSRREAQEICRLMNESHRCTKWAKKFPTPRPRGKHERVEIRQRTNSL